ncbi:MAG: hypothetical protein Q4G09_07940 [Clostridia bacterium]|nr:hypothetical protein [Clostridia bacterium]
MNEEYKKYIYISTQTRPIVEEICKEKNVNLIIRFINQYNLGSFMQTELRNLNYTDYLILDIKSIIKLTDEEEIIRRLTLIRRMYNLRIIIIAEGYKSGNVLLGKLFNLGIYNIITANDDIKFKEELEKCLTMEGMTFGNSIKYKIDNQILTVNQTTKLVKENYIKVKQIVNIGIVGVEKHIGTTTLAINLTRYLSELPNIKACYIENNNNNSIINIATDNKAIHIKEKDKITYMNIDMFLKPKNMSDILANNYNFYIYDYGSLNELSKEEQLSFLTRDLKLIVSGNKLWEITNLINCFQIIGEDINSHLVFNFVSEQERESFKNNLGQFWKERCTFSEIITNPFIIGNKNFYETILKPYLLNTNIIEKKKTFNWFKRKKE